MTRDEHRRAIYVTASQKRETRFGLVLLCSGPNCHGAEMFAAGLTVADVLAAADAHIDSVDPDTT